MQNIASLVGYKHLSSGLPCQDYGVSFEVDGKSFCVLSDGCSTGGQTDLGSRYVALGVKTLLQENSDLIYDPLLLENEVIALISRNIWQLKKSDLFATLQVLCFDGSNYLYICFGDGCFGYKTKNNEIILNEINYTDNTPYYLLYSESSDYGKAWDKSAFKKRMVKQLVIKEGLQQEEVLPPEFVTKDENVGRFLNTYTYEIVSKEIVDYFFIATDGLTSIAEQKIKNIEQTLNIKGFAGDFVKRRLGAQTRVWLKNLGEYPQDDLTLAIVKGD